MLEARSRIEGKGNTSWTFDTTDRLDQSVVLLPSSILLQTEQAILETSAAYVSFHQVQPEFILLFTVISAFVVSGPPSIPPYGYSKKSLSSEGMDQKDKNSLWLFLDLLNIDTALTSIPPHLFSKASCGGSGFSQFCTLFTSLQFEGEFLKVCSFFLLSLTSVRFRNGL